MEIIKHKYLFPAYCVLPLYSQKEMKGKITNIDHCGKFFFQPKESEIDILECIQNSLKELKLNRVSPKVGDLVIVKFENKFHRAKVLDIGLDFKISCYFFDYGFSRQITFKNVFHVDEQNIKYFEYPVRGFLCKLSKIEPSFEKCPRGKWTTTSIRCFKSLAENKDCKIEIYSLVNGVASVELIIDGVNINEFLITHKFAIRCEESYASRQNHQERENYQKMDSSHWVGAEIEFKEEKNPMLDFTIVPPPEEYCNQFLHLEGPFSPLETDVIGVANNSQGKVKIDQLSVNSVPLDLCTENYNGQLLVAVNISGNSSNDTTLHNVSAMPNIPGLSAICALIFAPNAIFECLNDSQRITSIRTSLSYLPDNVSKFSNHECIIPVNVKIDTKDFEDINELRFNMSQLLNVNINITTDGAKLKKECVAKINELIFKILQRNREMLEPVPERMTNRFLNQNELIGKQPTFEFIYNVINYPKQQP